MKRSLVHVAPETAELLVRRQDLAEEADEFARASLSPATRKAIKMDWAAFTEWCAAAGHQPLPASEEAVATFFVDQAKSKKWATLARRRATIGKLHRLAGHPSPFLSERVRGVLEGIRRKLGVAQVQKAAMGLDLASQTEGVRDRAIVLLGLATSCRGAELCALDLADVAFDERGLTLRLRRSKTDQAGAGRVVAAPLLEEGEAAGCPARALRAWIDERGEEPGPLFRGFLRNGELRTGRMVPTTINRIVKRAVLAAGGDAGDYGAHSLRSGYVTDAFRAGLTAAEIMEQTGHKRVETVQRYNRLARDPHAASRVAPVMSEAMKRTKIKKEK